MCRYGSPNAGLLPQCPFAAAGRRHRALTIHSNSCFALTYRTWIISGDWGYRGLRSHFSTHSLGGKSAHEVELPRTSLHFYVCIFANQWDSLIIHRFCSCRVVAGR